MDAHVDPLKAVMDESAPLVEAAVRSLIRAEIRLDLVAKGSAFKRIVRTLADGLAEADLTGRRKLMNAVLPDWHGFSARKRVTISDMVARFYLEKYAPRLAVKLDRTVTRQIRKVLKGQMKPSEVMSDLEGWTRAYADTTFRTNLTRAYTAGQFQQAYDPDIADLIPAFEFETVGDANVRPNHRAAEGLLAAKGDALWGAFAPPLGHNCRCSLRHVTRFELEERGLFPGGRVTTFRPANFSAAHPDVGFLSDRPDRSIYMEWV